MPITTWQTLIFFRDNISEFPKIYTQTIKLADLLDNSPYPQNILPVWNDGVKPLGDLIAPLGSKFPVGKSLDPQVEGFSASKDVLMQQLEESLIEANVNIKGGFSAKNREKINWQRFFEIVSKYLPMFLPLLMKDAPQPA